MPLVSYRGSGSGARLIFGIPTREFLRLHTYGTVNKNPIYGSIIVIISIILVTVFLLLAPNSVQPIASYIAFSFLLFLPIIFILIILLKKRFLSPVIEIEIKTEDNSTYDELRRVSSQTVVQSPDEHKFITSPLRVTRSPSPSPSHLPAHSPSLSHSQADANCHSDPHLTHLTTLTTRATLTTGSPHK